VRRDDLNYHHHGGHDNSHGPTIRASAVHRMSQGRRPSAQPFRGLRPGRTRVVAGFRAPAVRASAPLLPRPITARGGRRRPGGNGSAPRSLPLPHRTSPSRVRNDSRNSIIPARRCLAPAPVRSTLTLRLLEDEGAHQERRGRGGSRTRFDPRPAKDRCRRRLPRTRPWAPTQCQRWATPRHPFESESPVVAWPLRPDRIRSRDPGAVGTAPPSMCSNETKAQLYAILADAR